MSAVLTPDRLAVDELCRRFGVARLDLFGSAADPRRFDSSRSDVDVLVEYAGPAPSFAEFLALRDALVVMFGRPVDLTMASAVRNPFLRAGIAAARVPLHGP